MHSLPQWNLVETFDITISYTQLNTCTFWFFISISINYLVQETMSAKWKWGNIRPWIYRKQESPTHARVTRDSAIIPRCPSAAILDFIEPEIASFDPPSPKTLTYRPNMEWIGCTVCEIFAFKLYCDLETGVLGHSRSSKAALFEFDRARLYICLP